MWNKNITGLDVNGTFRSLNGAADENVFIGKASKAGFFCFFKVWRDMPYDAVLDYDNILYRVEVKGASGNNSFDLTRGGRSGQQINRDAGSRERRIDRNDCDFVVCVDSNNGDCYILPVDVLEIINRKSFSKSSLQPFKEKWKLFMHGTNRLSGGLTRDGLLGCPIEELIDIASHVGAEIPHGNYKPPFTRGVNIDNERHKAILSIWYKLCE